MNRPPAGPAQQQPPMQQQSSSFEEQMFTEILRAMVHLIAKDMHSDLLDQLAAYPGGHPALIQALRQYNDQNEHSIRIRSRKPKAAGPTRQRLDGSTDYFNAKDASAAVRDLFNRSLPNKAGR